MPSALRVYPSTRDSHNAFVARHHRHSAPVRQAQLWVSVADLSDGLRIVGTACAGRPNARALCDGETIEIYRVCTLGAANACSMLYGALCSAAKALGYRKAVTYTLDTEPGTSPKAAGFLVVDRFAGRSWDANKKRKRLFANDPEPKPRLRWERAL